MPPPLLTLQDIHLTFGTTPLLSGAALSVSAGDRVCLVGRNGSGKSTLLRIAGAMMQSDSGRRFVQPGATIRYFRRSRIFPNSAPPWLTSRPASTRELRAIGTGRPICWNNSV